MLLRHTLNYLPAQLLAPLAQLVSMILWTHWLVPEEMGYFALVTATQELAYMFCLGWFSMYTLRFLPEPEDAEGRRRFLDTEALMLASALVPVVCVAVVTAFTLPQRGPSWPMLLAISACMGSRALAAHFAERARAQSSFLAYNLLQSAGPVLGLVFGMIGVRTIAPTAQVLWTGYALAQVIGIVVALPLMGASLRLDSADGAVVRAAWRFGSRFLGLASLVWIAENYIRYLVQWMSGAAALGLLAVGWGLGRRCANVAVMLVTTAAFPLASRLLNQGRRDDALQQLRINAAMLLGVILPITAAFTVLGPLLVELTVAETYREITADLLGLSVLSGTLHCLHVHVTDQLLVLERRFDLAARVDLIEIAVGIAASLVGLHVAGLHGAVIGVAVGSAAALVTSGFLGARLGFHWPWPDVLRIGLASAAMFAVLAWQEPRHGPAGLAWMVALGAAMYAGVLGLMYAGGLRGYWLRRARASSTG